MKGVTIQGRKLFTENYKQCPSYLTYWSLITLNGATIPGLKSGLKGHDFSSASPSFSSGKQPLLKARKSFPAHLVDHAVLLKEK